MIPAWFRKTAEHVAPGMVGRLEYYFSSDLVDAWGYAFNGQCLRQLLFLELLQVCRFEALVETGTFRGTTTRFIADHSKLPTYSCDVDPQCFAYSSQRLRRLERVKLRQQDSRAFLKGLEFSREKRLFFYLDAHWQKDLPLREEAEFIFQSFTNFVIMIDDFEVSDDVGYKFDDYGTGAALRLRDFPFEKDSRVSVYFPKQPSQAESGARRGCVVLASVSMAPVVDKIPSLRKISTP